MTGTSALRLLLIAGSAREGALSGRLMDAAGARARAAGAETARADLRALALPLYDGDIEAQQGVPAGALMLRDQFAACDAVLIVTPEYNGFPTPLFINAFDWLSRVKADPDRGLPAGNAATADKPVGLLSSSPGPVGGLRALNVVRQFLSTGFGMLIVPQQHALGQAHAAFADDGSLADPKQAQAVERVVLATLNVAAAMTAR
jgi:NAD(P)H-dependent FMN reductase